MIGLFDIHGRASEELVRQAGYYAERGGAHLARRFLDEAEHAGRRMLEGPHSFAKWGPAALGVRRVLFKRFPFALVYVIDPPDPPGRPYVVAVAHGKRRPLYWVRRLREKR